jgi:hypothetical protein
VDSRGAFIAVDDARQGRPLDAIVDAFAEIAPPGREVYVLLDHIHAVELSTFEERDTATRRIEKLAAFLLRLNRRGWATLTLSELTKSALNPEIVRQAPLAAFADSRKIASLADVPLVIVPGDAPRLFHIIAPKNRFGTKGEAAVELDPITWTFATVDLPGAEETAERRREEAERTAEERDRDDVFRLIEEHANRGTPLSRQDVVDRVKRKRSSVLRMVARLIDDERIHEEPAPARPGGGRRALVLVPGASDSRQEARSPSDVSEVARPAPVAVAPILAEDAGRFREVLARAFARLEAGRAAYGAFNVETDARDLVHEAEEELLDAVVYAYLGILKLRATEAAS